MGLAPDNIIHQVAITVANFKELEARLGRVPSFDEYVGGADSIGQLTYRGDVRAILLELYQSVVLCEFARCIQVFAGDLTEDGFYNDCLSMGALLLEEAKENNTQIAAQDLFEKIKEKFPRPPLTATKVIALRNELQKMIELPAYRGG